MKGLIMKVSKEDEMTFNDVFSQIYKDNQTALRELLDSGVNINLRDRYGRTFLINAVIEEKIEIAKILIERGCDVNVQDDSGWSTLHFAAENYLLDIANILIENGAKIDLKDKYGNTALLRAVGNSRERGEMIKLLLANGADKNLKNDYNMSPYELAKTIANFNIVQFFD